MRQRPNTLRPLPLLPPPPPPPPATTNTTTTNTSTTTNATSTDDSSSGNRFRDSNELLYSLRSLSQNALSWIGRIHLVTDSQIPSWLDMHSTLGRLSVVPHSRFFRNSTHLPVFSSPAIEANLHRLPGLTRKWLYFNDDVFLGSATSPSDFFASGDRSKQKFYTSWDAPKCAPGCSDTWIGDGYCDKACNVSKCGFDFPDCVNKTSSSSRGGSGRGRGKKSSKKSMCVKGCPNTWVGDKVCDNRCNALECAWDAGDCGVARVYDTIQGSEGERVEVDWGTEAVYFNLTDRFKGLLNATGEDAAIGWENARHNRADMVQNAVLLKKHGVLVVMLRRQGQEMCGEYCEGYDFNGTVRVEVEGAWNGTKAKGTMEVFVRPRTPTGGAKPGGEPAAIDVRKPERLRRTFEGSCEIGVPKKMSVEVAEDEGGGESA